MSAQEEQNDTSVPSGRSRRPAGVRRARRRQVRALALLAATTIGALWVAVAATLHSQQMGDLQARAPALAQAGELRADAGPNAARPPAGRPVYRYSVVPGGVHAAADVVRAMAADPVVAAQYAGVDTSRLRVQTLAHPVSAHVSYRIGDRIYWTGRKLQLAAGEQVLTDGTTTLRARCGNMVSTVRRKPTFAGEPEVAEFEQSSEPAVFDPDRERLADGGMPPPTAGPPHGWKPGPKPGLSARSKSVAVPAPGSLVLVGFALVGFVALYVSRYRRHADR